MQQTLEQQRSMIWSPNRDRIKVRNMSCGRIWSLIHSIEKDTRENYYGFSSAEWIETFKTEIRYRDKFGDALLSIFPKFYSEFRKTAYPMRKKVFTTKGIKYYNGSTNPKRAYRTETSQTRLQVGQGR